MLGRRYKYDGKSAIPLSSIQLDAKKRIEDKISAQVYKFQEVCCPVCESCDYELLAEKDRYGLSVKTVICKGCGLVMNNPAMTQDSLNKFYADDYAELYRNSKQSTDVYFNKQYARGKKIIEYIKSHTDISINGKSVIEVGCAAGGILAAFRDEGAGVVGLDLGNDYLKFGKENHRLNLENISLSDYISKLTGGEVVVFDIIIYNHVLEHCLLLPEEIRLIKSICHEKTLVYIEVPGLSSTQKVYKDFLLSLQNAHLYYFSLGTLINIFSKNGFSLVCGNERIHSLFTVNNQSAIQFKNCYNANISYLKHIEITRIPIKVKSTVKRILKYIINKINVCEKAKKFYQNEEKR